MRVLLCPESVLTWQLLVLILCLFVDDFLLLLYVCPSCWSFTFVMLLFLAMAFPVESPLGIVVKLLWCQIVLISLACAFFFYSSIESKQEPSLLAFWLFYLFLNHIFSFSILPQWHVLSCAHVKVQKYTFINGTYYTFLWSMTGQCIKHTPEMILTT